MSQQILIKRSSVSGKVPTTAQLALGELALNTYDGSLYLKKNVLGTESIVEVGATSITGDATGSGNESITLTLSSTGVAAGTYPKVTVDVKGRVTAGSVLSATDIPSLPWSKITTGKPTTLEGYGITDGWGQGVDIPTAVDLDTYTTSGWYHQNTNTGANTGSNYPVAKAGMLEVFSDGAMIYQRYQTYDSVGDFFYRSSYNAVFGPWKKSLNSDNITAADIPNLDWSKITTGKPTTLAGYGITDSFSTDTVSVVNPATPKTGDVKVVGSVVSIYAGGAWRQIFPAVYS